MSVDGSTKPLVMEEFRIPNAAGLALYVRNKHPAGLTRFTPEKTLLYVHGATYPASTSFDLALGGFSWMDYIAERGYDVYLLDVHGYGHSARPPQMDQPPDANPPFAGTEEAMRDVDAVVEFVKKRRGISKLTLMGWSWGTAIMQWYASLHSDNVHKLMLYAPVGVGQTVSLLPSAPGPMPAYRAVSMDQARQRWIAGVPTDKQSDLIPAGWFETWADATLATDPVGSAQTPPVLRAPNGVVADGNRYWRNGVIPWQPEHIKAPVLLIIAEWDQDTPVQMARNLFTKLTGAPDKRYIELGEGTHTILMEKNRMNLFREVQLFLDEVHAPAT